MKKRTYENDIIALSLLYRKKYASIDMISYDKIRRFDEVINKNLDEMEANYGTGIIYEDISSLYFNLVNENGQVCAVLNPKIDLNLVWKYYIGNSPLELLIAIEMDNALKEIGLISVNDKILDRNKYYNELTKKYNLLYEIDQPQFNIFRDWENISEDSFVEKYCISKQEQLILKELRENKKTNEQNTTKQINILKKTRKTNRTQQ